jgi:hypothetical protein
MLKSAIRFLVPVIIALSVAVLAAYAISLFHDAGEPEQIIVQAPPAPSSPYSAPGIKTPEVVPAAKANLKDDASVIGIEANGRYRAYSEAAMTGMTSHVVNDLIDNIPVTVTYCDLANCARAFTGSQRGKPLEVSTGGMVDGNLALRIGTIWIKQPTGETMFGDGSAKSPLQDFPITRTTWKVWRERHPDTDVYIGQTPRS